MATTLPTGNRVFREFAAVLSAVLLQAGFLVTAEPSGEAPKPKAVSTLPAAEEGAEPVAARDGTMAVEREQTNFRTWTDASGKYGTEAAFLGFDNGQVRLEKRDGVRITIAIENLAEADQEYVKEQIALAVRESELVTGAADGGKQPVAPGSSFNVGRRHVFMAAGIVGAVLLGILVFWATYCRSCKQQLADLNRQHEILSQQKIVIAPVVTDPENKARLLDLVERMQLRFPVLLDKGGEIADRFGVYAVPTTAIIDTGGRLSLIQQGYNDALAKRIFRHLKLRDGVSS